MNDADEVGDAEDDLSTRPVAALATVPDYSTLPPARPSTPMGVVAVVAVVAVKLAGLYCFVEALPFVYLIPADLVLLFSGGDFGSPAIVVNLFHPTAYLLAGLLLVRRASWVATRVLGFEDPADYSRGHAPGQQLKAIAFSVVGVWLAVGGLVEAARVLVQAHSDAGITGDDLIQSALRDRASLTAVVLQLALGVWLFVGASRLAQYWHRFRNPQPVRQNEPSV